ncbi:hypothetical protein CZ787_06030 [Halomonas citrativorans]|uniref:Uncharacterized protein n=1 Tax=Halomonas citrativorans TaxID=2742612 RepID=A0A1R4HWE2_9GAMM|nr:hypothetical protein [Halomonas citrativorans]SJN11483.1 hypothetical protein CZ787_06030 [Halomonas citrativorans]
MRYDLFSAKQAEMALKSEDFFLSFDICKNCLKKTPGDALLYVIMARIISRSPMVVDSWQDVADITASFLEFNRQKNIQSSSLWHALSFINSCLISNQFSHADNPFIEYLKYNGRKVTEHKVKLLVLTCVWKRHELCHLFFSYYKKLKEKLSHDIDIQVIAVGSEGEVSQSICEKYGAHYLEYPNQPLSDKWQAGLTYARSFDFDALVILGSDDFICENTLKFYSRKVSNGTLFLGFQDCYLHDFSTQKTIYWKGYGASNEQQSQPHRVGETIGLGRVLRRELLEFMDFDLWKGMGANKSLDGIMKNKITEKTGFLPVKPVHGFNLILGDVNYSLGMLSYRLKDLGLFGVDVKVSDNVTAFEKYVTSTNVYDDVTLEYSQNGHLDFLNSL